jgi:predicted ATPase
VQKEIIIIIGGPGTGKSTLIDGLTAKGFVVILKSLSNFGSKETRNRAIISENPAFLANFY